MGLVVEDIGTGRGKPVGVRDVFQGSGTVGAAVQVVDMGADPPYGTGPGKISSRCCKADNRGEV